MSRFVAAASFSLLAACSAAQPVGSAPSPTQSAARARAASPAAAEHRPSTTCSRAKATNPLYLVSVVIRGSDDRAACAKLGTYAGAPLEDAGVESDIRALFATGHFDDVVAVAEDDAGALSLVFEVKERPRIGALEVVGAPPAVDATSAIGERPERLDPVWLRGAEARVADALQESGYRHPVVGHEVRDPRSQSARVRITVAAGSRFTLGAARFEGLAKAKEAALRNVLLMKAGEPATNDLVERDTLVVGSVLYDLGLVESAVTSRVEENASTASFDVIFTVTEGPVYALGKVKVKGARALPAARYEKLLASLKPGGVFVRTSIANLVQDIESMHRDAGAPAHVDVESHVDAKKRTVDLDLVIQ
ncbi:MAG TPA: POTRA domain-containing protein [Polyangiaceae bacterium]|nr:POTRA domain-containing protein [Polyangiaceae bacterium]